MPAFDVVDLIMTDHREVERLFEIMTKQPETRVLHFPVLSALLICHSRAEEAEVYPVAREEAGETDEVAHSQQEHAEAESLLEQMATMDPMSQEFEKALQDLITAVTHHVEEEESLSSPACGVGSAISDAPSWPRRLPWPGRRTWVIGRERPRRGSCSSRHGTRAWV
jgi:hypothetical protein